MRWVTWEGIGIDRMACAWLIRRRIDPEARFLFIPEPFDIPGTRLSHHQGRCSFATFLAAYDLQDPVLARIARIVDEADTVQEVELEPAAAGVDLVCRGLRRISPDDHIAVDHGVTLYDALYAQLEAEG
jgi:hypothetical protein